MKDIDFTLCEFITKNMNFLNYFDFCDNCYVIKELYKNLNNNEKQFYKWYVYANIHMSEYFKNVIWSFLNSDNVEEYLKLIDKKRSYRLI